MRDMFEFMGVMAFLLGLAIAAIIGFVFAITSHQCGAYADTTGRETRMVFPDMCLVNVEGIGWITYEELKAARTAELGLRNE